VKSAFGSRLIVSAEAQVTDRRGADRIVRYRTDDEQIET
jgi:hypothetical protein